MRVSQGADKDMGTYTCPIWTSADATAVGAAELSNGKPLAIVADDELVLEMMVGG